MIDTKLDLIIYYFFDVFVCVLDTSSIIEHLAGKCVLLSRETSEEDDAWGWLAENQASGVGKASVQAWRLLERLLPKAENGEKQTRCHRAAARRILDLNCTLPYWLAASFKLRNPAELISVYHQAGLLEEAAQVRFIFIYGKRNGNVVFKYNIMPFINSNCYHL